jgi:hypothetical protein
MNRKLAFVAVALRDRDGSHAAYFGDFSRIEFRRDIPMLPSDRLLYRQLAAYTVDARAEALFAADSLRLNSARLPKVRTN